MTSNQARKPIIIKKKETGKYNRRIGYQIKYHDGLGLRYFPNFLSKDEADNLYNTLLHELDWYRVQYPKYGRTIVTPRYTTFLDMMVPYTQLIGNTDILLFHGLKLFWI